MMERFSPHAYNYIHLAHLLNMPPGEEDRKFLHRYANIFNLLNDLPALGSLPSSHFDIFK